MPLFDYVLVASNGKRIKGSLEAPHLQEAKELLRRQQSVVLTLEEHKEHRFTKTPSMELKEEMRLAFTAQLAQLLSAGIPLYQSLLSLEEEARGTKHHALFLALAERVKKGQALSSAMIEYPRAFPSLYCACVAAGEASGALDATFMKLAALSKRQLKVRKELTTALLYPLLLGGFCLVVVAVLLIVVIPSLEALFEGQQVGGITHFVMGLSHFVKRGWPLILLLGAALPSLLLVALKRERGRELWHRFLLRVPIVKTGVVHAVFSRFCRTLGTLLEAGVALPQALEMGAKTLNHPLFEKVVEEARIAILAGSFLSKELRKSPLVPSLAIRMLAIGEESGSCAKMLLNVADLYEEELTKTLNRVVALAQPVILLILGGIVGLIMLGILLPLTDVSSFMQ